MSSVNYNRTEKLRFWCQKVLPIVYDDSLSYYELLNKVVVYLNSTIEDVQSVIDEMTTLEQSVGNKIDKTQKGVANGVATLDGTGKVPLSQLPDVSAGVQTISVNGVNVPADANRNVNIVVMTNSVSNLVNYYLKTETYNKSEVNALIDNVKNSRFEVVAQLPTSDIQTNVIYLVPKIDGGVQNGYDEYINLDGTTSGWELIGSTDIDLSGYVTDSELTTALTSYVTTQALNATLADYVSNSALATALSGYVQMSMFNALSGVVSEQGEALEDRVDIFAVTQSRETGDTATTLHNVNTFVWVDKLTNIFGSHLFKVTQTVNVDDNWASIKSSKLSDVTVSGELRDIEGKIPATASASNKLATAGDITAGIHLLGDTVGWISKNKIPIKLSDVKELNTSGTWNENVYSITNITLTFTEVNGYVTEITANGTPSADISVFITKPFAISAGEYVLTANIEASTDIDVQLYHKTDSSSFDDPKLYARTDKMRGNLVNGNYHCRLFISNGNSVSNVVFKPMLLTGEQYDLSPVYEPYHESVKDWYWSENAKTGVHNFVLGGLSGYSIGAQGNIYEDATYDLHFGIVTQGESYTVTTDDSAGFVGGYFTSMPTPSSVTYNSSRVVTANKTFTAPIDGYVVFRTIHNYATPMFCLADDSYDGYTKGAMTNRELTESLKYRNVQLTPVPNTGTNYEKVVNVAEQLDALITDVGVKFSGYVLWTQSMFLRVEAMRCNATTLLYTIFNVSNTIYNGAVQNGGVTVYKFEGTQMTS